MSVTNHEDSASRNVRILGQHRFAYQSRAIANTDVQVVPAGAPSVQLITTSGTGPAVLRLPLAELDGTVYHVVNLLASTQLMTITDDAGSPVTLNAIPTDAWVMVMKVGAAYQVIAEGVLTLA